jgi:pimeloyl-ACP methyl ester carboxylesterase
LASYGRMQVQLAEIDGLPVRWLEAPGDEPPVLYVHGVPDSADLWRPFLERSGGIAVDLPGFGASGKPAEWPYSVAGYQRFLHAFLDHLGLERVRLVAHDWGAVAFGLGERVERLVAIDVVPFVPGHRWHWVARAWRTPLVGELGMGVTSSFLLRRVGGLSPEHAALVMRHFDHGTQRAILKLYRANANGPALADVHAPALVLWGEEDRYLPPALATELAGALGGPATVETVPGAGHWPWMDRQEVIDRAIEHLRSDS